MNTGLFDILLADLPFVIADAVFTNPKYRGYRLPPLADTDMTQRQDMCVRHGIRIHDARSKVPSASLGLEGFQILDSPVHIDFSDRKLMTQGFYEHCAELVRDTTQCLLTLTMQHEFRTGFAGTESYARTVHADLCPYIEDLIQTQGSRHFAIFNVWRGTEPQQMIKDIPLALCDRRTVDTKDIVYADAWRRTNPRTRLVDCRLIHNEAQKWYYFPDLNPDEVLIFKQYDTREKNPALRTCFHTAFINPGTPGAAPRRRRSVEARVLAIFPEQESERNARVSEFKNQVPKFRLDGSISDWCHEVMQDWHVLEKESGKEKVMEIEPSSAYQ
ncbi:MAG: hypothetical protein F4X92_09190 [Gammaproteobacteria bacterium]|nr:hypothetical protein [Gammaproteobacteria bacterium]